MRWRVFNCDTVDGIGLQLGSPYTGVNLDGCRDSGTGDIEPLAQKIIASLNSYTEVSPRGCGVHIWVKGNLPPGGRKKGHIEMYCTGRFLTVTGLHLDGTPKTVEERQTELTDLAVAVRAGSRPKLTAVALFRPIGKLLCMMVACAAMSGLTGFSLAKAGLITPPESVTSILIPSADARFMADWWAHSASYAVGFLGGIILCVMQYRRRAAITTGSESLPSIV
jgi:hypothetical protein